MVPRYQLRGGKSGHGRKITVRITNSCSPESEVAITSIDSGFSSRVMSNSTENRPRASGGARIPLTLTVAAGEVSPATVINGLVTTVSPSGEVPCKVKSAD